MRDTKTIRSDILKVEGDLLALNKKLEDLHLEHNSAVAAEAEAEIAAISAKAKADAEAEAPVLEATGAKPDDYDFDAPDA